jgi:hypothetical protein
MQTPEELCQETPNALRCYGATEILCEQAQIKRQQYCPDGCEEALSSKVSKCRDRLSFSLLVFKDSGLCAAALDPISRRKTPVILEPCDPQKPSQMWRYVEKLKRIEHFSGLCLSTEGNVMLIPCDEPVEYTAWEPHDGGFRSVLFDGGLRRFLQPFGVLPSGYIEGVYSPNLPKEALVGQRLTAYTFYGSRHTPRPAAWIFWKP